MISMQYKLNTHQEIFIPQKNVILNIVYLEQASTRIRRLKCIQKYCSGMTEDSTKNVPKSNFIYVLPVFRDSNERFS